ncbi:hypothetical protein C5O19_22660 [Siphonobacter curvatus]|uniref:Lipoprotein n=2 Tax=Siphonobacter curvatus TaxID=2094562 RepID=A0A2S7IGQ9_9BACT|nr:hypothetical protein C5O19_22660 [Siphonobacter curvatus]
MKRMNLITFLLTLLSFACQKNSGVSPDDSGSTNGKSYIKVNFNGHTKTYKDVTMSLMGGGGTGTVEGWSMTAGSNHGDYLSIGIFSRALGTFPYRQSMSDYHNISIVQYQQTKGSYDNYKALVCPTSSGYYSTQGKVVVEAFEAGKLAKGTFTGNLLVPDTDDCSTESVSFSGEFYLVK